MKRKDIEFEEIVYKSMVQNYAATYTFAFIANFADV